MTEKNKAIIKICPKCNKEFQCMENQIQDCHCNSIKLNDTETKKLKSLYNDCLCNNCLSSFASKK